MLRGNLAMVCYKTDEQCFQSEPEGKYASSHFRKEYDQTLFGRTRDGRLPAVASIRNIPYIGDRKSSEMHAIYLDRACLAEMKDGKVLYLFLPKKGDNVPLEDAGAFTDMVENSVSQILCRQIDKRAIF